MATRSTDSSWCRASNAASSRSCLDASAVFRCLSRSSSVFKTARLSNSYSKMLSHALSSWFAICTTAVAQVAEIVCSLSKKRGPEIDYRMVEVSWCGGR